MKADISVIIPLYNKGQIIERTIKSVLCQTYPHFELIIVDDGSTDNSVEIVRQFDDERIRLVQQPNYGPSAARNTGASHATTDWIVFLDGDDEFLPNTLEIFGNLKKTYTEADIYNCRSYIRTGDRLTETRNSHEGYVQHAMRECYYGRCMPGAGFSMYRKRILEKFPYDEHIRRFEDAELLIRMLPNAKIYSSQQIVQIHDVNYAEASGKRKDISEDYAGHLSLKGKTFWAKMCVYRTYLENRELYPEDMRQLYPTWRFRYDLFLIYKLLNMFI